MQNKLYLKEFMIKFPEVVSKMKTTSHFFDNQNMSPHHLEDDVWTHTLLAFNALDLSIPDIIKEYKDEEFFIKCCVFGVICHDLGKIITRNSHSYGKINFRNHDSASIQMTVDLMTKMGYIDILKYILPAISNHIIIYDNIDNFKALCNYNLFTMLVFYKILEADTNGSICILENHNYKSLECLEKMKNQINLFTK